MAAMAYRPHAAVARRAAVHPRRAPADRSLALRVDMRMERVEGGRVCLTDIARQSFDSIRVRETRVCGGRHGRHSLSGSTGRGVEESGGGSGAGGRRRAGPWSEPWEVRGAAGRQQQWQPHAPRPCALSPRTGTASISNKLLNIRISQAGSVEDILDLVDQHHGAFNYINVATAVTRIAKRAKVTQGVPLASDERYAKLMRLVVQELQSFEAREMANVFYGLTNMQMESRLKSTSSCSWVRRLNESPPT